MENCNRFWAHNNDDFTIRNLAYLANMLNGSSGAVTKLNKLPQIGRTYAAPFKMNEDETAIYYRAKVSGISSLEFVCVSISLINII